MDSSDTYKFRSGESQSKTISKDAIQIADDFHAAFAIAPLLISEESCIVANRARSELFSHSSPFATDVDTIDAKAAKLILIRLDLLKSAKRDIA
jgi:hypothetical protein